MKRTFGIIAASAFAIAAISAPVAAAPSEKGVEASCFGQIHQAVNAGFGPGNVGELVQGFPGKGSEKNDFARGLADKDCTVLTS